MFRLRNKWSRPFDLLRTKWTEVPVAKGRRKTVELQELPDEALWECWKEAWDESAVTDFAHRGWYYCLYRDVLRGKRVLDVGSGLGFDAVTFAQAGAQVTCLDIAESNLATVRKLCRYRQVSGVDFFYMQDMRSLSALPRDYDVIWCSGSMHHAPFAVVHEEAQILLEHLRPDGRWIELGYPRARWERDGKLDFDKWGEKTDGGAPWVEWYDLEKVRSRLAPARFDVVLHLLFHDNDFIWFDLVRVAG
jgi:2-polyprenyl-3-methyl-5-hydroxy-6-metoxy-1,4-benzoquinol methylase